MERWLLSLLPPSALVLIFLFFHKIVTAAAAPHNWPRLQRTFILASGEKLYYPPDGPVVLAMYGPVSALVYWPVTWFHLLSSVMQAASIINLSLVFLPASWVILRNYFQNTRAALYGSSAFLIFLFFHFSSSSLRSAAFNIHADAPALGFSALACAALLNARKDGRWSVVSLGLSAFFSVMAFWSKQVTAPILPALLFYAGFRGGRREFFRYFACLVVAGGIFSAVFIKIFGFDELWFNLVTIPANQPWRSGGGLEVIFSASRKLFHESFFVFLFSLIPLTALRKAIKDKPWFLFLWVAVFMLPAAIIGRVKTGASNNVLCYVPYFVLLAGVLALADLNIRSRFRVLTNLVLGGFLLAHTLLTVYKFVVPPVESNFAQAAYDYAKKHPGETYFPRLTLVHLLTERKIYHESVALIDRDWAGIPVPDAQLRAFIPERAQFIAFHEASGDDRHWMGLPEYSVRSREPELPGFVVYRKVSG